jgi:uncharacterized protein (TIGR03118 family)
MHSAKSQASYGLVWTVVCLLMFLPSRASAQYVVHSLVANVRTLHPRHIDPNLVDPWGISRLSDGTFWIADQNTSVATAYNASGRILPERIQIPCVVNSNPVVPCTAAPDSPSFPPTLGPTGLEMNAYVSPGYFEISDGGSPAPATLLFATTDGLIGGWNPSVSRSDGIAEANRSGSAVYKGIALAPANIGPFLYVSNNKPGGGIDVFGPNFNFIDSFSPPTPAGTAYHPHGVDIIGDQLYITYAGMAKGGVLDVCYLTPQNAKDPESASDCDILAQSTESPFTLNAPWGVALAPSDFGQFSDDLLVGNVNDGRINAFDPVTGEFLGALNEPNGTPISFLGMWDLDFETGRNGAEQLFFAAGPGAPLFSQGIFGVISSVGRSR